MAKSVSDMMLLALECEPESGQPCTENMPEGLAFPLRDMDSEALAYVMSQKRFSLREIKWMMVAFPDLELDDIRADQSLFYEAYFDIVERQPAMAVAFDYCACTDLSEAKTRIKMNKKPSMALSLGHAQHYSDSVGRVFAGDEEMSTALRVAFFYDYATREWDRVQDQGRNEELMSVFYSSMDEDEDESDDAPVPDAAQALDVAKESGATLTPESDDDDFVDAIAMQEEDHEATIATVDAGESDASRDTVEALKILADMESDAAEAWARAHPYCANALGLALSAWRIRENMLDDLRSQEATCKAKIEDCTKQSNLKQLKKISAKESKIKAQIDGVEAERAECVNFVKSTVSSDGSMSEEPAFFRTQKSDVGGALTETAKSAPEINPITEDATSEDSGATPVKSASDNATPSASDTGGDAKGASKKTDEPSAEITQKKADAKVVETRKEAEAPQAKTAKPMPLETPTEVEQDSAKGDQEEAGKADEGNRSGRVENPDLLPDAALFADLIRYDMPSVAARVSEAIAADGLQAPLSPAALNTAAIARILGTDYTPEFQRLLAEANTATTNATEADAAMVFGATLAGAIFVPEVGLRDELVQVKLGSFGAELNDLKDFVAGLPFSFSPGLDELASLAGTSARPRTERSAVHLASWVKDAQDMKGPCLLSTRFLQSMVKPGGKVRATAEAIVAGAPDAMEKARATAALCEDGSALEEALRKKFKPLGPRNTTLLGRKSRSYINRRFGEVANIINGWLDARESKKERKVSNEERRLLETLKERLVRSANALEMRSEENKETAVFDATLSNWLSQQLSAVRDALDGEDLWGFASEEEAQSADAARLLPEARRALAEDNISGLLESLRASGIPTAKVAVRNAIESGAFETAKRLERTLGDSVEAELFSSLDDAQAAFAGNLVERLQALVKQISGLLRHDLNEKRQAAMPARFDWLRDKLGEAEKLTSKGEPLTDLDATAAQCTAFEAECKVAEDEVRADQLERVNNRLPEADEKDRETLRNLIRQGNELEFVENGIALLRDGRALGAPVSDDGGPIEAFTANILPAVDGGAWPKTANEYSEAFADSDNPLATDEARRKNALQLMKTMCALRKEAQKYIPDIAPLQAALEALGFRDVKIQDLERAQSSRTQAWKMNLRADVSPQPAKSWFLPPAFGSGADKHYHLVFAGADVMPEVVYEALSDGIPAFVLVAGPLTRSHRHEFAEKLRSGRRPAVLIDEALAAFVASQRTARLETVFACGLPYGFVESYVTNPGKLPPEMFFGREEEIQLITSRDFDGCLVYGGRQLGKSALLNQVQETTHDLKSGRVVVLRTVTNLGQPLTPSSTIWHILHGLLMEQSADIVQEGSLGDPESTANDIQVWLAQEPSRRILVLLDEADEFMSSESANGFPEIIRLKDLMEKTNLRFKIVFAGLHNVQRMYNVINSPLAHFLRPIVVGPLNRTHEDKRAARDLVIQPLRAAGYRFEEPAAVDMILAYTNEYPSLIQEFLQGLLRHLHRAGARTEALDTNGPIWSVPTDTVFKHERFEGIENEIRRKFRLTLKLDTRYALVANVLGQMVHLGKKKAVLMEGIPHRGVLEAVQDFWPKALDQMDAAGFRVILDEMYELGVLGKIQEGSSEVYRYCLRSPQVLRMLGQPEDIDDNLLNIRESEPPARYNKAVYRPSVEVNGKYQHLPLTVLQLERLLAANVLAPRVVCGLKILGLERMGAMLEHMQREMTVPGVWQDTEVQIECPGTQKQLRVALDRAVPQNTVRVVVHMHTGSASSAERILDFMRGHPSVLSGKVRPLVLFDAEDDELRNLANRQGDTAEFLVPWGEEFLRMHLHHVEANSLDQREYREAIIQATGGVPEFVVSAVKILEDKENVLEAVENLEPFDNKLPELRLTEAMRQALELLVENPRTPSDALDEHYDALDSLILDATRSDLSTLGPDLKALGLLRAFVPTRKVIEASELGALIASQQKE